MTRSTLQRTLRCVYITIAAVLAISLGAKFVEQPMGEAPGRSPANGRGA